MLHEIYPHIFSNAFRKDLPDEQDYLLCFKDNTVLLTGEPSLPTFSDLGGVARWKNITYLFKIDDRRYWLADAPPDALLPGCDMHPLQTLRDQLPQVQAFAGVTAGQLYRWYRDTKYCGRCGAPTRHSDRERALVCDREGCTFVAYPKIAPAIIVAISDGSRLLMTRSAIGTYRRYALVAGFVEVGETFEEAVAREVYEEVGLRVKNIRYYKSQPWGVSDSEMIGFFADLDGDDTITLQDEELSEAVWFAREDIPPTLTNQSVAQELIEAVRAGLYGTGPREP